MSERSGRVYSALIKRNPETEQAMPAEARHNIAPNGLRQVFANALQSSADHTVNASTVLPWLFATLGVPAALTGLLVPIRESGSMLPQAALTPLVVRVRHRKWILVVGSIIEALAVAVMAATAGLGDGLPAGLVIIAALAVFAFGRCLTSIASKDVLGRTIPKGERGQINGLATTAAGVVAITLGLGIRLVGGENLQAEQIAWMLAGGAVLWLGVAWVYAGIREPAEEPGAGDPKPEHGQGAAASLDAGGWAAGGSPDAGGGVADGRVAGGRVAVGRVAGGWVAQTVALLRDDKPFRHFVSVRSLLLVSSLSPPFLVTLSIQSGAGSLAGLGGFIVASGVAALIGGPIFGRLADRSSKRVMSVGAGVASAVIIVVAGVVAFPGFSGEGVAGNILFLAAYFTITLMHTGVRVGRKTYVVDMADGDKRTAYVAVANSAMGVILLVVGGISSALAAVHILWALLFLAVLGFVGVYAGARLPDVSKG